MVLRGAEVPIYVSIQHCHNFLCTMHWWKIAYAMIIVSIEMLICYIGFYECVWEARFALPRCTFAFQIFFFFSRNFLTFLSWIVLPCTVHGSHKLHFSATFSLKMGPTILFTHLKIILLQYFSVFNCIQTDPISIVLQYEMQELVLDLDIILSLNRMFGMNHIEC